MQGDRHVPIVSGCEKWHHSPPVIDPTFFKDSFSNIRLEIHLGSSQGGHTDTITNISFHYCICGFKWHIYILSAWELDKQLQQIGWERQGTEDLAVDFYSQCGIRAQQLALARCSCCLLSAVLLDSEER